MPAGGYQKPKHPAPYSGPGKFSRRTDGGPSDKRQAAQVIPSQNYGDRSEMQALQTSAPLAATGSMNGVEPGAAAAPQQASLPPIVPLDAPTTRPDEPITAGIDMGPGPGANALGISNNGMKLSQALERMLPYDNTGEVAVLYQLALSKGM